MIRADLEGAIATHQQADSSLDRLQQFDLAGAPLLPRVGFLVPPEKLRSPGNNDQNMFPAGPWESGGQKNCWLEPPPPIKPFRE